MKRILVILISILILSSQAMAYEEANYKVVKENKGYEIRKYSDRLVVETNSIEGNGFRKLFNYISGNNEESQEIKMTVPVTQEIKNENMTMQFYLPSKFNKDDAPKPSNSDIKILTIEGGYYAVIKYSGRSSDKNFLKNKDKLKKQLKQDNITIIGPPIRASYNSPFTLPMLKRNEVMYRINL
ncbi:heme-binding protein [Candidatus Pelagibacter sp.]|nr:heme-binding protein [Candidatus Pelagibacter sp.]